MAETLAAIASCSGELPVMQAYDKALGSAVAPDWSCYDDAGTRAGTVSTRREALFRLKYAPGGTVPTPGVAVDFYFSGSTLGAPDVSGVTDAMLGSVMVSLPDHVERVSVMEHAYKDVSGPGLDTYEAREYDLPVVDGEIAGTSYIRAGVDVLPANVVSPDARVDPAKAYLVALVKDCAGRPVRGAQFDLLDGETGEVLGDSQSDVAGVPHPVYSHFALPSAECTFTSLQDASWAMLYAPPNVEDGAVSHLYRLRVKGRKKGADAEAVTLLERDLELFPGTLTSVRMYKVARS